MKWLAYTTLLFLGFAAGWLTRGCCSGGEAAYSDTVTVVDTVTCYRPVLRDSMVVRYETVRLMVADTARVTITDTVRVADSVEVVVPITQKVYEDSLYRAYVSGYRPQLDSIYIFAQTSVITKTLTPSTSKFGIFAGIGGNSICGTFVPSLGIDAVMNGKYIIGADVGYYNGITYGVRIGLKIK